MQFKDLSPNVKLAVLLMHNFGIIEQICDQQGIGEEAKEEAITESLAVIGISAEDVQGILSNNLSEQEALQLEQYLNQYADDDSDDEHDDTPHMH